MSLAVLLLAVSVLIVGLGLVVLGQASDVRGKAQKAADAASLAAAEEAKRNWIDAWVHGQIMPTTRADGYEVWRDFDHYAASAGGSGYWEAVSFAQANSNSTVRNYSSRTPGFRTVEITVDTDSEVVDAQGTTSNMIGDVQGNATATAELSVAGVSCIGDGGQWEDNSQTLIAWKVTCSGNGASASVQYDGAGNAVSYSPSAIGRLFDDIRLIN